MPSVKVLVVHYRHKPGGYSHRLRMKIEAFLQEGWEVHYIAVEPYPYSHPNLVPHILWSPTPRFDTPLFWAWFFLVCPLYTLKVGLNIRPHLISVFSPPYGWICRLLKRLGKIPMAVFLRTVPNESLYSYRQAGWANRIEHGLNAGGLKAANLIVANSETVLTASQKFYDWGNANKTTVLPNNLPDIPCDREAARGTLFREFFLPQEAFTLATTGRFHKGKNIETLLRAVARQENRRTRLLLFGEGEELEPLKQLSAELGVDDRVTFCGWREDVSALLPGIDLFILPSLKEGMSNSLMEALACGVPCLVSDIAENREVISRPEQRFACEDVDRLAELIAHCREDGAFLETIRQHTREDAGRFDFDWGKRVVETVRPLIRKQTR
ncbi:MAG: glycosyltransferase family 4 protein [Nitrospina sp.]|nr:glycosyltransferase family 4 protein [Nitrospina sp.]